MFGKSSNRRDPADLNPSARRWQHAVAVFTLPEREIARLDIRVGPCVPPVGRSRPLIGVTRQRPGYPGQLEVLFGLLVQAPDARPWQSIETAEPGRLAVFGEEFVSALAALNREAIARGEARPTDYDWILGPERRIADQWLAATAWEPGVHAMDQLGDCGAWARVAQDRGQKLYCWSGPGFSPYVLARGSMEELPAYLEAKRRG